MGSFSPPQSIRVPEAYGGAILEPEEGGLGVVWGSKGRNWGWQEVDLK